MNILYIAMDGFDTASPNIQMAGQLIDGLLKPGNRVHLIQSEPGSTPITYGRARSRDATG